MAAENVGQYVAAMHGLVGLLRTPALDRHAIGSVRVNSLRGLAMA